MNFHQSNVFLQDRSQNYYFSLLAQPFCFSFSQSISTIHGGVSHRHSQHLMTEEEFFLHILSVLSEMRSSSLLPTTHNCFRLWQFFSYHPEHFVSSFHFIPMKAIISGLFILSFQLSFSNLTGASFKYPLISSWSLCFTCILILLEYLLSFFNSYGGPVKIPLPMFSYQFIRCFQIPPVDPSRPSQVCAISLLNPFQEE